MDLFAFAGQYPELYSMLTDNVGYIIDEYNMNGEESLLEWDNLIDRMVNQYEENDFYGTLVDEIESQQFDMGGRRGDRDRDRDRRRRRRFRDFDLRDALRLIFLRELFDRRRRHR